MEKILVIEDNDDIRKQLKWGFSKDYNVLFAIDFESALKKFNKQSPKVVTLDLGLPPRENDSVEGFRCLEEILRTDPFTKVIVITGQNDNESARRAIQLGAYDFYQKPIDLSELGIIIGRALYLYNIEEDNRKLQNTLATKVIKLGEMVGQCSQMLEVFSTIRKVASSDISILISGESGTGKELVSRAIHSMSLRKDGPFVPIDCGAIPDNLLESELFGFEKGAFTGAHMQLMGKVEYANHGTLFLDEIGEMSSNLQAKLLRFIQEKKMQRVGGREDIHVNARIIAATNIDISKAIEKGNFREDLYYRIGVITIHLPPLRDRGEDVLLLAKVFLKKFTDQFNKSVKGFSSACSEFILSYDWPGNVRELENRIQRAVIMTESPLIEPDALGFSDQHKEIRAVDDSFLSLKEAKNNVERLMIIKAIHKHKGNITRAAGELGVSRPTFYDLMKKHSLQNKNSLLT